MLSSSEIHVDTILLDAILLLAAFVIVPFGLGIRHHRALGVYVIAAALLGGGLVLPGGIWAAVLALPWLLMAVVRFAVTVVRDGREAPFGEIAALAFLVVGAGWAVLACGGWSVLGFDPVIVQLTAIHFHYAGFALTMLATAAARMFPGRLANAAIALVLAGVPSVAAGISFRSVVAEWWATLLLSVGCVLVAILQMRAALAARTPIARTLLAVSAVSLLAGMALAIAYAAARRFDLPELSIPLMIRTHGLVQSVGFAVFGLLGWHLAHRRVRESVCRHSASLMPYNSA
jgi:hypothetical protein